MKTKLKPWHEYKALDAFLISSCYSTMGEVMSSAALVGLLATELKKLWTDFQEISGMDEGRGNLEFLKKSLLR